MIRFLFHGGIMRYIPELSVKRVLPTVKIRMQHHQIQSPKQISRFIILLQICSVKSLFS